MLRLAVAAVALLLAACVPLLPWTYHRASAEGGTPVRNQCMGTATAVDVQAGPLAARVSLGQVTKGKHVVTLRLKRADAGQPVVFLGGGNLDFQHPVGPTTSDLFYAPVPPPGDAVLVVELPAFAVDGATLRFPAVRFDPAFTVIFMQPINC